MHRAFASVLWSLSLLMCNNALATGEGCAPLVAQGLDSEARQLYIKSANSPHWKKLAFDSTDNVAGQRVNFLYVVERPDESDLKPGAIAIKVQRYTTEKSHPEKFLCSGMLYQQNRSALLKLRRNSSTHIMVLK